jgi:hypothetical protein
MGAKCDSLSTVADDDVRLNYENDLIHFYEPFIDYRSNHLRKNRNIDCVYILEKAAIRILKPERGIMGLESAVRCRILLLLPRILAPLNTGTFQF